MVPLDVSQERISLVLFNNLRLLALLRRIAKALEKANHLSYERMSLEHPGWDKKNKVILKAKDQRLAQRKALNFSKMDVQSINERFEEEHPNLGDGI